MNVTGIIAEYNPFHKGHQFHIEESRRITGADYVIAVMSGNFLQRGEAACMDKFSRAEMALSQGADLVLELPLPFALSSAPDFARGGVGILDAAGVTTHLSFGSEWGNLEELTWLAHFLEKEPDSYKEYLAAYLKSGLSYPKARLLAFKDYCCHFTNFTQDYSDTMEKILDTPNNILSIAYLRSLSALSGSILPVTVKRSGGGYHDTSLEKGFASATAIRSAVINTDNPDTLQTVLKEQLPPASFEILSRHLKHLPLLTNNDFSSILFYKLLTTQKEELISHNGISEYLCDRIHNCLSEFTDFQSFTLALKRKNDSYTSISRYLWKILLDITPEDTENIPYLRILGFRKDAGPLLHALKKQASLPLITKPSDARYVLDEEKLALFEKELKSEQIYHGACHKSSKNIPYNPYKKTPVIL